MSINFFFSYLKKKDIFNMTIYRAFASRALDSPISALIYDPTPGTRIIIITSHT